jgi:DNA polymerase/3'-5' exonuclease PolX
MPGITGDPRGRSGEKLVDALREIADLLDLAGERFKPEAYRRAARSLEPLVTELPRRVESDRLAEIPGVGPAIEKKIREYFAQGTIAYLERLREGVPEGVRELLKLSGVGPRTARRLWTDFGIESPAELSQAISAGRLDAAAGFGQARLAALRAAVASAGGGTDGQRRPILEVAPRAEALREWLAQEPAVERVEITGSYRRRRESIGDIDLLVSASVAEPVFERFSRFPDVASILLRGSTKETLRLKDGLQVDLRVVRLEAFGAAAQYFTGSKDHNVRLRGRARSRGLKINEYGVYRGEERIAGATEEEVYAAVGLPWIPPELREDRGEIEAAESGGLPRLVEAGDLQGEIHRHLGDDASVTTLDQLRRSALERGLGYLGIVVAILGPEKESYRISPEIRQAILTSTATPTLLPLVEVAAPGGPSSGFDLGLADPHASGIGSPPLARVHLPADSDPLAEGSAALPSALEVGPWPGQVDSETARRAVLRGVPLLLPTGLGEPEGSMAASVALGYARRAWATAERVRNCAPWPWTGPPSEASVRPRPSARGRDGPATRFRRRPRSRSADRAASRADRPGRSPS